MGTNSFKVSAMVPNAWFYKLNDMERTRKKQHSNNTLPPKKQYHHYPTRNQAYRDPNVNSSDRKARASMSTNLPAALPSSTEPPSSSTKRRTKVVPVKPSSSRIVIISSASVDCTCRTLDSVRNVYTSKVRGKKAEEIPVPASETST